MEEYGFEFGAMASRNEVRVLAPDEARAHEWAQAAIQEVRRIEAKYSRYRDDSVTSVINRAAGQSAVAVDAETASLLDFAAEAYERSQGRFDLTSGVLRRVWDFRAARVPSQAAIDAVRPLIGWHRIQWRKPEVYLPQTGMQIDLGGIGKEYAADRAAAVLLSAGARHGFVNLGGDVRSIGAPEPRAPWSIAIQHPRDAQRCVGALPLDAGAVATSGDYERFFEVDGTRYCHIFDPRTGWPNVYWQSVSVAAPLCAAAGAYATIAMLMPVDEAIAFLTEEGVVWLGVAQDGRVYSA